MSQSAAAVPSPPEAAFVASMAAYARRLSLAGEDPPVVFTQGHEGALAIWNTEKRRYEVETASAGYPGLDRYVALMGRFMAKHYDRCFVGAQPAQAVVDLWQELRSSLVEYVISTGPDSPGPSDQRAYGMALFKALQHMEAAPGTSRSAVRRLALELLDRYDCAWTRKNLVSHVIKAAADLGNPPEDAVRSAFAAQPH